MKKIKLFLFKIYHLILSFIGKKNEVKDQNFLGLDIKHIKEIMFHPKVSGDCYDKNDYHNEQLIIGRNKILQFRKYTGKTPLLYNPDEINEYNSDKKTSNISLGELMSLDHKKADNNLFCQEFFSLKDKDEKKVVIKYPWNEIPIIRNTSSSSVEEERNKYEDFSFIPVIIN